jgi:hypothetical protein
MSLILNIGTNSFIILFIYWMLYWDMEPGHPIKKYWIPKIKPVFLWLGLTAEWKMFSPNPFLYNSWPIMKIFLENGEFVLWEPTEGSNLNFIQKIRFKKSQKFYHEVGREKASFHIKRDFIEYILNKNKLTDRCTKVEIYRVHQNILPFDNRDSETPKILKKLVFTFNPE